MRYDLLIRGGRVVDPLNTIDTIADLGVVDGKISALENGIDPIHAAEVIDATGLLVMPGIVDAHVHVVREDVKGVGYTMLLRKGVTTALDMSGPIDAVMEETLAYGQGLTVLSLHALGIGKDIKTNDPGREEIAAAIDAVLEKGAFGIKILGGHYPLTPEATALIIEECAKRGVYIATHAGTTKTGSNILGLEEAVDLSQGHPLHVAHVNAYCRGQIEDPISEARRMLDKLRKNPHIVSEGYLSVMNGTTAAFTENDTPKSNVTRTWLEKKGYTANRAGMAKAIEEGWALIYANGGGEMTYLSPEQGMAYWKKSGYTANCSFPVNNPVAMLAAATGRREDGSFVVNAISTDGGGIPRNVIFENGIRLVGMRYMELRDFVAKSTLYPARMLGLTNKGHFSPGADADIAVFDMATAAARYTITGGKIRMAGGICSGGPGTLVTTEQGLRAAKGIGLPCILADMHNSTFRNGN